MANTGNIFVGTGENLDRAGSNDWANPGNILSDDATDAIASGPGGSDYLIGRNCGFSIPTGATITGVLLTVEASEHSGGTEALLAQLQDETATLIGTNKTNTNEGNISGTTKAIYTFGSTSDLWGATLTPAIINDANFGVRVWFETTHEVRIDYIQIQIEYTIPPTSLTLDAGTFNLTGSTVNLKRAEILISSNGSYSFSGTANLLRSIKLISESSTFTFTGEDVTLVKGYLFSLQEGSYSFSGSAGLIRSLKIASNSGTYNLTGQTVLLNRSLLISGESTTFNFTGQDVSLIKTKRLNAQQGSFSLSGVNVGLTRDLFVVSESGSYNFTGGNANLNISFSLSNTQYNFTGASCTLTYTPISGNNYTVVLDSGNYTLSGGDIKRGITVILNNGVYLFAGENILIEIPYPHILQSNITGNATLTSGSDALNLNSNIINSLTLQSTIKPNE